ncbi:MAG: RNA 2',3'-cyclic phosphodiesterase [Phycisphaerae bacterium]
MRLFIAIMLPDPLRATLHTAARKLAETRANIRWVVPAQYHITVKFLGETDDVLVPQIAERLTRAAAQVPIFTLHLEGPIRFPPLQAHVQPRIIAVNARSPDQRLTRLHRLIDSTLGGMGLPMDTRTLTAHVTLGRISSNHGLNRLLRQLPKHEFDPLGTLEVSTVTLLQSVLGSEGPVHTALHAAPLAAIVLPPEPASAP